MTRPSRRASARVRLEELNWLSQPLAPGDACEIQIRYRAPSVPGTVVRLDDRGLELALAWPVRAIAPGQSGVLYGAGGRVLGGGVITD